MGQSGKTQLMLTERIVLFCKEKQGIIICQRSKKKTNRILRGKFQNGMFHARQERVSRISRKGIPSLQKIS